MVTSRREDVEVTNSSAIQPTAHSPVTYRLGSHGLKVSTWEQRKWVLLRRPACPQALALLMGSHRGNTVDWSNGFTEFVRWDSDNAQNTNCVRDATELSVYYVTEFLYWRFRGIMCRMFWGTPSGQPLGAWKPLRALGTLLFQRGLSL
jgi:hypothetical protein